MCNGEGRPQLAGASCPYRVGVPITILQPVSGPIGPGVFVSGVSDFVGPLPEGSHWQVEIRAEADGVACMIMTANAPDAVAFLFQLGSIQSPYFTNIGGQQIAPGAAAFVNVELHDNVGAVLDSGTREMVWEPASSSWALLQTNTGIGAGGFTEADRTVQADILAGIRVPLPAISAVGGFVLRSLAELVASVPPRYTSRHGSILISGQGSVAVGTEPFRIDAVGMEWHWNVVPGGFGYVYGSVNEFFNRVVQFRLIHQDLSGQPFQGAVIDSSADGERYTWGGQQPITVEWYVAPGCIVELSFLVMVAG